MPPIGGGDGIRKAADNQTNHEYQRCNCSREKPKAYAEWQHEASLLTAVHDEQQTSECMSVSKRRAALMVSDEDVSEPSREL
ncbi:hypothetical protein AC578_247 [Pseudocercospora eumusae]|uniref:Uncharacterized protein n=1 Tax=Pseudocercospora eumusae TaxID=321146 RepID=A0A139HIK7_9PEZI|nr:hypothetical protein AC578_247 [Pseudocercospora eumusae]